MLRDLFVNPQEHRLRAFWRLAIQAAVYLGLAGFLQIIIGVVAGLVLFAQGANLQDRAVLDSITRDPLVQLAVSLGSLAFIFLTYVLAGRFLDRRPFRDFGFHFSPGWWADFAFGLFLGALIMTIFFLIELQAGWITVSGFFQSFHPQVSFLYGILAYLVVYLCVGFSEEMFSRGYQLRNLAEGLNYQSRMPRAALLIAYLGSSAVFGMLHFLNPNANLLTTLYLMGAGLLLGFGYLLTGELAIPIGLHIAWNFFQGCVYGFPVSGLDPTSSIIAIQQAGPVAWTGGAFGPEGGYLHPLAVVFGCLLIYAWVRWRRGGKAAPQDRLAQYSAPVIQSGPNNITG